MSDTTRIILEKQGSYVGRINQRLAYFGPRGNIEEWIDAGGGGDFFDPTPEDTKILKENGSPVIVYPGGRVERSA